MLLHADMNVTSPKHHLVTAQEALEPLYERFELEAETKLLAAAVTSGWPPEEAALAVAKLRLKDALTTIEQLGRQGALSYHCLSLRPDQTQQPCIKQYGPLRAALSGCHATSPNSQKLAP